MVDSSYGSLTVVLTISELFEAKLSIIQVQEHKITIAPIAIMTAENAKKIVGRPQCKGRF